MTTRRPLARQGQYREPSGSAPTRGEEAPDFRPGQLTRIPRRLLLALAASLALHALPFLPGLPAPEPAPLEAPPLEARLKAPPPLPEAVPLRLPEPPRPAPPAKPEARRPAPRPEAPPRPSGPGNWTREVQKQLQELDRRGLFYPEEAIARGLEGQAVVFLVLDEAGNVAAARIEESSGHRILDEAALRAVRSLKALPAAAPRETLLPVRFRLR